MSMANRLALQDIAITIPNTYMGIPRFIRLLSNVKDSILVPHNVVGSSHAGPHSDKFALRGENLHPTIGPVTDIDFPLRVYQQTVDQVEMTRFCFPRLSPGLYEPPIAAKPVHPGVAVPIGDINISRGAGGHFSTIVEGASGPRYQVSRFFTSGVRADPPVANNLQRFTVQGEFNCHMV
jgi:hypothetical protein